MDKKNVIAVEIWLEFIHFSIGGMGETNGIENVRSVCERAISLAGLHVTKGHILWEAYREFESAILSGYQVTYIVFNFFNYLALFYCIYII